MKKRAIILCISMILSVLSPIVSFAAVSDDATDGIIKWSGCTFYTQCGSNDACSCGYMYTTDENKVFHFELEPTGTNGAYGAVHAIHNAGIRRVLNIMMVV